MNDQDFKLLASFGRWLHAGGDNGDWLTYQAHDRGPAGHAGEITIGGIPVKIDPTLAPGTWAIVAARFAGEGSRLILPDGYGVQDGFQFSGFYSTIPIGQLPPASIPASWLHQVMHTAMGGDAPYESRQRITHCDACGAAHWAHDQHVCTPPSDLDTATVMTIQRLAASGLSAEEIAADMGVVCAWRCWDSDDDGLTGAGVGETVTWRLDQPLVAVCADAACALHPTSAKAECAISDAPRCRVHALKARRALDDHDYVIGQVALWGDVIECEDGWLASRAYPLAFESEVWARAYRVARCAKDDE